MLEQIRVYVIILLESRIVKVAEGKTQTNACLATIPCIHLTTTTATSHSH